MSYMLEVRLTSDIYVVESPSKFSKGEWVPFLADCFPDVSGYALSRAFQDNLKSHLDSLNLKNIHGYSQVLGEELCIPDSQNYLKVMNATLLPNI